MIELFQIPFHVLLISPGTSQGTYTKHCTHKVLHATSAVGEPDLAMIPSRASMPTRRYRLQVNGKEMSLDSSMRDACENAGDRALERDVSNSRNCGDDLVDRVEVDLRPFTGSPR